MAPSTNCLPPASPPSAAARGLAGAPEAAGRHRRGGAARGALHALHASANGLDFRLLQVEGTGSFAIRKAQTNGAAFSLQASRLRSEAANVWSCLQAVGAGNERHAASVPELLKKFRAAAQNSNSRWSSPRC
ncbi:hypothetical protein HK414_05340 [Ramlibacter terrae]|uniref:Uncharacterized protein n=1 Tax=Ramlibacter terrae TaxID=2732511 RepID=A0ABX6P265_9BURK|nr:hypothetical protein HK414_05340 [Ramlibacter terrae]